MYGSCVLRPHGDTLSRKYRKGETHLFCVRFKITPTVEVSPHIIIAPEGGEDTYCTSHFPVQFRRIMCSICSSSRQFWCLSVVGILYVLSVASGATVLLRSPSRPSAAWEASHRLRGPPGPLKRGGGHPPPLLRQEGCRIANSGGSFSALFVCSCWCSDMSENVLRMGIFKP